MNEELIVAVRLNLSELYLLKYSIESAEKYYRENLTDEPDWRKRKLTNTKSILKKLDEAAALVGHSLMVKGDKFVNFSMTEIALIDWALTKTEGDVFAMATKKYDSETEMDSSSQKYIEFAQDVASVARIIETARRLAMLELRVAYLTR